MSWYKGKTYEPSGTRAGCWTATINHIGVDEHYWEERIRLFGETQEEVEKLRDRIINSLKYFEDVA